MLTTCITLGYTFICLTQPDNRPPYLPSEVEEIVQLEVTKNQMEAQMRQELRDLEKLYEEKSYLLD